MFGVVFFFFLGGYVKNCYDVFDREFEYKQYIQQVNGFELKVQLLASDGALNCL